MCPKVKPDNVIRHEIVLGRADRELLSGAIAAYQINKIATPFVAGMSDVSFVAVMALSINYLFDQHLEVNSDDGMIMGLVNQYEAYRASPEYQEDYEKRATSFLGGLRNFWDNLIGGLGKGPDDLNI